MYIKLFNRAFIVSISHPENQFRSPHYCSFLDIKSIKPAYCGIIRIHDDHFSWYYIVVGNPSPFNLHPWQKQIRKIIFLTETETRRFKEITTQKPIIPKKLGPKSLNDSTV